jgi:hypothetical protein
MWSAAMSGDAALSTGLEFYRREVERRRFFFRRILLWSFGPGMLAIATLIVSGVRIGILNRSTFPKAMPFLTLVAVWVPAYFVMRMRQQRELQREIDELNDIERANR